MSRREKIYFRVELKACHQCEEIKSIDEFYQKKTSSDAHDSMCKECRKMKAKERYAKNPEIFKAKCKEYQREHPGKFKEYNARWKLNNPAKFSEIQRQSREKRIGITPKSAKLWAKNNHDKVIEKGKRYRAKNRELSSQRAREWQKKNPAKCRALWAKRRSAKIQGTPYWANKFFIEEIHDLAIRRTISTGFKWHVDHDIPLRGKLVCGLHVENNLRVIPARHNLRKSNLYHVE